MTAKQLFERAMLLLGYVDEHGDAWADTALQKRAVAIINQIAADLTVAACPSAPLSPVTRLDQDVPIEGAAAQAMPFGVAMLLAQSQGDADSQAVFTAIYNRKRAGVGGIAQSRQDVLP